VLNILDIPLPKNDFLLFCRSVESDPSVCRRQTTHVLLVNVSTVLFASLLTRRRHMSSSKSKLIPNRLSFLSRRCRCLASLCTGVTYYRTPLTPPLPYDSEDYSNQLFLVVSSSTASQLPPFVDNPLNNTIVLSSFSPGPCSTQLYTHARSSSSTQPPLPPSCRQSSNHLP
jgi:hypothetical protein